MTSLDWIIVGATVVFAVSGYFRGFIVGALSLIGFAAGAVLGTRLASGLLSSGDMSPYAPAFGLFGAVLAGGILASGLEGLGLRLRRAVHFAFLGVVDGLLGAGLSACVALGIAWILGTVALQVPGADPVRMDIQKSTILQHLDELLPPSGVLLHALARFDPLPSIAGPQAGVAPPAAAVAGDPAVRRAAPSVVRVLGSACGLGIEGSGWVVGPGEVVTNAHVVAGEHDTVVQDEGNPPDLPAEVVVFDPHDDIAVLRVAGLDAPSLQLASDPPAGRSAAILGYPRDGPFDVEPGRIGTTQSVQTQDAYGNGPVTRLLTPIRGLVRPGNSGGPMVDSAGQVVTTVFAATTDGGPSGGFGVANATVAHDVAQAGGAVSTEGCAD
ncbi:MAG TPA: MarP family serine protease [Solirubrobacteraceae bacterium]|jgi:S1-C subfamily serine protease|nr:MarP family serine protease [Solirubrobacteraceae bacterium]